jgi:4-hydroxybenzoate polyprenyltransferase
VSVVRALFQSLRPYQWTKNLVVFVALGLSKHLLEPDALGRAFAAFAVFCAVSGAVYLVNDLVDLERDRLHPTKRSRPLASGRLPPGLARIALVALGGGSLLAAFRLDGGFGWCVAAYVAVNLAYSFWLKNTVILDVLTLSIGFVLRAVAGALVIGVEFSGWLLACTLLLALFLSLAKRRHEIVLLAGEATSHRRSLAEYSPYLLDQMIGVVTASSVVCYALYTMAEETVQKYGGNYMAYTIPFVLYGVFRYLYLVHQKEQGGSPTDLLLADRPLLVAVALWAIALLVIVYTGPGAPMPRTH